MSNQRSAPKPSTATRRVPSSPPSTSGQHAQGATAADTRTHIQLLVENIPDTATIQDLKQHFSQQNATGAVTLDIVVNFQDSKVAEAVMRQTHQIKGTEVKLSTCIHQAPTVQDYTLQVEERDKLVMISNVKNVKDLHLEAHFLRVKNGGDGNEFTIDRPDEDTAILKFQSARVVENILKKSHIIEVDGALHEVTAQSFLKQVVLNVESDGETSYCLRPSIIREIGRKFPVTAREYNGIISISGDLKDIARVQSFLQESDPVVPSIGRQPTSYMGEQMNKFSLKLGHIMVYSYLLNAVKVSADMVAALTDPSFTNGQVFGDILHVEGKSLKEAIASRSKKTDASGVYFTASKMRCFGIMLFPCTLPNVDNIGAFVKAAISAANNRGFKSIALPLLGSIRGSLGPEVVAQIIANGIKSADQGSLLHVHLLHIKEESSRAAQEALRKMI